MIQDVEKLVNKKPFFWRRREYNAVGCLHGRYLGLLHENARLKEENEFLQDHNADLLGRLESINSLSDLNCDDDDEVEGDEEEYE